MRTRWQWLRHIRATGSYWTNFWGFAGTFVAVPQEVPLKAWRHTVEGLGCFTGGPVHVTICEVTWRCHVRDDDVGMITGHVTYFMTRHDITYITAVTAVSRTAGSDMLAANCCPAISSWQLTNCWLAVILDLWNFIFPSIASSRGQLVSRTFFPVPASLSGCYQCCNPEP